MGLEAKKIEFLKKPNINIQKLNYIKNTSSVFINLFEIIFKKEIKLYQYPYKILPQIEPGDLRMRKKLFKSINKKMKEIYGEYFFSGDCIYSLNNVNEEKILKSKLFFFK